MNYRVQLTYFKDTGKFYSEGEYVSELDQLWKIFQEVAKLARTRALPGLVKDHGPFYVVIDVPEHPHRHPHLIPIDRGLGCPHGDRGASLPWG